VSLEDKEFIINTLYPSNGFLMVVHNTEEYYVTMTDEEIEFGNRVVDIYGNTFYDDVSIYVEEVLPEIGAVIL
jgi:P pilus assembly chaperone PapD